MMIFSNTNRVDRDKIIESHRQTVKTLQQTLSDDKSVQLHRLYINRRAESVLLAHCIRFLAQKDDGRQYILHERQLNFMTMTFSHAWTFHELLI